MNEKGRVQPRRASPAWSVVVRPFSGAERLIGIVFVGLVGAVDFFERQLPALLTAIGLVIAALGAVAGQLTQVAFDVPILVLSKTRELIKRSFLFQSPAMICLPHLK
jgi:hypothetical protein